MSQAVCMLAYCAPPFSRLGQKKRVLMGLSDIQGWGAFLQQPAGKDEFVVSRLRDGGEWCGRDAGR